eukprot:3456501-Lingulodinium_polyedra.AAC.1
MHTRRRGRYSPGLPEAIDQAGGGHSPISHGGRHGRTGHTAPYTSTTERGHRLLPHTPGPHQTRGGL